MSSEIIFSYESKTKPYCITSRLTEEFSGVGWYIHTAFLSSMSHLRLTSYLSSPCSCPLPGWISPLPLLTGNGVSGKPPCSFGTMEMGCVTLFCPSFILKFPLFIARPLRCLRIPHHWACKKLSNSLSVNQSS